MSAPLAAQSRATTRSATRFIKAGMLALAAISGLAFSGMADPAAAAKVKRIDTGQANTTTILFNGRIDQGDLAKLKRVVNEAPQGNRVVLMLRSPGGRVDEGLALGRFVHAKMITTVVPQGFGCHSACSYVFLAGRDSESGQPARIMMSGAKVGFHQVKFNGSGDTVTRRQLDEIQTSLQDTVAQMNAYFREIGVDGEFMELSLSAASNEMAFLSELQALRLGIYVMDTHTGKLMTPAAFRVQASLN